MLDHSFPTALNLPGNALALPSHLLHRACGAFALPSHLADDTLALSAHLPCDALALPIHLSGDTPALPVKRRKQLVLESGCYGEHSLIIL